LNFDMNNIMLSLSLEISKIKLGSVYPLNGLGLLQASQPAPFKAWRLQ